MTKEMSILNKTKLKPHQANKLLEECETIGSIGFKGLTICFFHPKIFDETNSLAMLVNTIGLGHSVWMVYEYSITKQQTKETKSAFFLRGESGEPKTQVQEHGPNAILLNLNEIFEDFKDIVCTERIQEKITCH